MKYVRIVPGRRHDDPNVIYEVIGEDEYHYTLREKGTKGKGFEIYKKHTYVVIEDRFKGRMVEKGLAERWKKN